MFGNIPKEELMTLLDNSDYKSNTVRPKYGNITTEIINQNEGYCEKIEGLAMGLPLKTTLANIYTNNYENQIMNNSKHKNNIKLGRAMVDDILLIQSGTDRHLDKFLTGTNSITKYIQFIIEKGDKIINYLDLTIQQSKPSKYLHNIYGKPTYTDSIIPNNPYHHHRHKMSSL